MHIGLESLKPLRPTQFHWKATFAMSKWSRTGSVQCIQDTIINRIVRSRRHPWLPWGCIWHTDHTCQSVVKGRLGPGPSKDPRRRRTSDPLSATQLVFRLAEQEAFFFVFGLWETCSAVCMGACTKHTHECMKHVPCVYVCVCVCVCVCVYFCDLRGLQSNIFSELDSYDGIPPFQAANQTYNFFWWDFSPWPNLCIPLLYTLPNLQASIAWFR